MHHSTTKCSFARGGILRLYSLCCAFLSRVREHTWGTCASVRRAHAPQMQARVYMCVHLQAREICWGRICVLQ